MLNQIAHVVRRSFRRPLVGSFQPYKHSWPDRYPWLFHYAADTIRDGWDVQLLSFGCARGDEVFTMRRYFPKARVKGVDIDRANIIRCRERARALQMERVVFAPAATTVREVSASYDAIFCLAVLCHGDLATTDSDRCEPLMRFGDFERAVTDFARCLKPGGLLFLHTTNFRFCDTSVARHFDTVLEADPQHMVIDTHFSRSNRRLRDAPYRAVGFRKHGAAI
jgi:SAM-dependent methyltransferase